MMKIGILAWAVRHALQRDFTGTLRALAQQGYDGIHFLGDCDANGGFRDLGQGVAPLPDIMAMLDGRVAWAICDHSNEAEHELRSTERCMEYLRLLGISPVTPPS